MTRKRQHYVWRYYLNGWADINSSLYAIVKEKKVYTSTENLGVKKYFYKVKYFSKEDESFMRSLLSLESPHSEVQKQSVEWVNAFSKVFRVKDYLDQNNISSFEGNEMFEKMLKDVDEKGISNLENSFIPLFKKLSNLDIMCLNEYENYFDLLFFTVFTYIRTRNIRDKVISAIAGSEIKNEFDRKKISGIFDRTWSFTKYVLTTSITFGLIKQGAKVMIYNNESNVDFITTDQPVINTKSSQGIKLEPKDLEFYFPLTPKIAILITFNTGLSENELVSIPEELVNHFNEQLFDSSSSQQYFSSQDQRDIFFNE